MDIALFCSTAPVIESSSSLRFGCFTASFFTLKEIFADAQLSIWSNEWFKIHDFTPNSNGSSNWSYLPLNSKVFSLNEVSDKFTSQECSQDIVPPSVGNDPNYPSSAFVLVTKPELFDDLGWKLIKADSILKRSHALSIPKHRAADFFALFEVDELPTSNLVLGLEFAGDTTKLETLIKMQKSIFYTLKNKDHAARIFFEEIKQNVF